MNAWNLKQKTSFKCYFFPKALLKGIFRSQLKTCDGAFFLTVNYFSKKRSIINARLGSKYVFVACRNKLS